MASPLLASDLNNPDFTGATNPDRGLAVRFYSRPLQNNFLSEKEGRPIFQDVDMVQIMVPGDATSIIDTPVREDHRQRFPIQWAHYQNKHGTDTREIGTPLSQWTRVTASQVEELRALKIYTVENIAEMSDANLQRINMIAGTAPHIFREHAKRFLALAKDDALAQASEDRAKGLEEENARLKKEMADKFAEMQEQIQSLTPKEKRKYVKKTKEGVE